MRSLPACAACAVALLVIAGCSEATAPDATQPPPAGNAAPAQPSPAPTPAEPAPADTVLTAQGWGPLKIGMSREEITAALGPQANPDAVGGADPEQCDQYHPSRAPDGLLVMVEGGRLTRISLNSKSSVATDKGIAVGATPEAVRTAYGAAIQADPHKYQDPPAQYLTVWNRGDGAESSSRGVRYEVDGTGKVAWIHAGGPSITYVEGCS